ncbi:MAG: hypothetical protein HZA49_10100 [Planctomycetes bacterium]|nr:hypothetical protein [Planctomycetota bacterium]
MYKKIVVGLFILAAACWLNAAPEEKPDNDASIKTKISATARAALVQIRFEFQKDPEEGKRDMENNWISQFISEKMTWDTAGVLIGSEGMVLLTDYMMERKYIKKITVIDSAGAEYEAEMKGFLQDYSALFLNIKGDKKPAGGVKFASPGVMDTSRKLYAAGIFKENENWFVRVMPASLSLNEPFLASDKTKPFFQVTRKRSRQEGSENVYDDSLLFDEKGDVIGYPLEGRIEVNGNLYGWRGSDLMENTLITFNDLDRKTEELKKEYLNYILEIKFKFRQQEQEKGGSPYARFAATSRSYRPGRDDEDNDLTVADKKLYGLVIDKNRILIPDTLEQDLIHRIENVEVLIGDKYSPAEFMGVFKDFGAMLIKVPDNAVTNAPNIYKSPLPTYGRTVYAINVKEKFDKRHEKVGYDRFFWVSKGYKNRLQYTPYSNRKTGTVFVNSNNELMGILMEEKRDLSETLSSDGNRYNYRNYRYDYNNGSGKVFFFNELKDSLITPTAHFDLQLIPLSDREMKRIVCLGVEFQALNKELTEQLGCQKATRNGEMGLLINHIYPESPAEKSGLKTGDILLKVQEEGKDDPIELKGGNNPNPYDYLSRYGGNDNPDIDMGSYGISPWPSRNNYFTQILTRIGAGKKITLTYWRDNQELKQDFVLEKTPYDFDSSDKYKDETIGITVKDLTYEVKHHLRLAPDYKAVIISKVEEGSKAAIGKLRSFELLTKINEQPIGSSVDEYKKLMEKLIKEEKQTKLRFTIERKGKSRFVDIELEKAKELPKEGIKEEDKKGDGNQEPPPKDDSPNHQDNEENLENKHK